jgi:hypothetical protein
VHRRTPAFLFRFGAVWTLKYADSPVSDIGRSFTSGQRRGGAGVSGESGENGTTGRKEVVGDSIDSRETAVLFRGRLFDAVAEEISVVTHASEKMSLAHSVSVQIAVTRAL